MWKKRVWLCPPHFWISIGLGAWAWSPLVRSREFVLFHSRSELVTSDIYRSMDGKPWSPGTLVWVSSPPHPVMALTTCCSLRSHVSGTGLFRDAQNHTRAAWPAPSTSTWGRHCSSAGHLDRHMNRAWASLSQKGKHIKFLYKHASDCPSGKNWGCCLGDRPHPPREGSHRDVPKLSGLLTVRTVWNP